ncbi:hypothetical protein AAHE18_14G122500 [Arachis hypogaea]
MPYEVIINGAAATSVVFTSTKNLSCTQNKVKIITSKLNQTSSITKSLITNHKSQITCHKFKIQNTQCHKSITKPQLNKSLINILLLLYLFCINYLLECASKNIFSSLQKF